MSQPNCTYCGGLHYGSPTGTCVYLCTKCQRDIRVDAVPRCSCPKDESIGFWQSQRERERQLPNALIERMIEIYDHRGSQETKFEAMQRCAMLATTPRKEPQHGAE